MSSIDDAVIARIKKEGKTFEILVDPEKAREFKEGKTSIQEALVVEDVFTDSAKGIRASREELKKLFGSDDVFEVAKTIILKGEIQLTTEQRRKMKEEKLKRIISFIAKNAIDPRTKLPHPPQRIEKALEEAKFNVDIFRSDEVEIEEAIKAIKKVMPIVLEMEEVAVRVPAQYSGKIAGMLKQYKTLKEEWLNDGGLAAVVRLPGGQVADFIDKISKATHGEAEVKIIERK